MAVTVLDPVKRIGVIPTKPAGMRLKDWIAYKKRYGLDRKPGLYATDVYDPGGAAGEVEDYFGTRVTKRKYDPITWDRYDWKGLSGTPGETYMPENVKGALVASNPSLGYYYFTAAEEALIKAEMEGTGQSREEVISILTAGGYISGTSEKTKSFWDKLKNFPEAVQRLVEKLYGVKPEDVKDVDVGIPPKPKVIPGWTLVLGIGVLVIGGGILVYRATKKK